VAALVVRRRYLAAVPRQMPLRAVRLTMRVAFFPLLLIGIKFRLTGLGYVMAGELR
jgi:hypothetical protein